MAIKFQHPFLSTLVTMGIPGPVLFHQNVLSAIVVGLIGLAGMLLGKRSLALGASLTLLFLLVFGKITTDILKLNSPDTAVFLAEFIAILALMEASTVLHTFTEEHLQLKVKSDELSQVLRERLEAWLRNQLSSQARLSLIILGLSLGLLPVAGFTSITSNQLALSATLALLAVVLLMFLVVHRREPETA